MWKSPPQLFSCDQSTCRGGQAAWVAVCDCEDPPAVEAGEQSAQRCCSGSFEEEGRYRSELAVMGRLWEERGRLSRECCRRAHYNSMQQVWAGHSQTAMAGSYPHLWKRNLNLRSLKALWLQRGAGGSGTTGPLVLSETTVSCIDTGSWNASTISLASS